MFCHELENKMKSQEFLSKLSKIASLIKPELVFLTPIHTL